MSRKTTFITVFVIALAAGLIGVWSSPWTASEPKSDPGAEKDNTPFTYQDLVVVDTPTAGQEVSSPVNIEGKARGPWYFEASFPVTLRTRSGEVLAETYAQADGDWMTEDFVPFSLELEFSVSEQTQAEVVFKKANPSGLPENADQVALPVTLQP